MSSELLRVEHLKQYFPVQTGFGKTRSAQGRRRCLLLHQRGRDAWTRRRIRLR